MKKILTVTALALTIGVGSIVVKADSPSIPKIVPGNRDSQYSIEDREQWNKERREIQKDRIQRYVEEGRMTEAEAKQWEEHYEYMEKFHNENGYMQGGCHSGMNGMGHMGYMGSGVNGTDYHRGYTGNGSNGGHMGRGMMRGTGMGGMMRGNRF